MPTPKPPRTTPRRCPSRHRDAEDFRYVKWCPECGAIRKSLWDLTLASWRYPTRRGR